MAQRIAIIKTGWSDDFTGSPVEAAHAHVRRFKEGHEKYNFLPGPDGRFYGYTPPVSGYMVAPKPPELEGWLVFALAKSPKRPGLYLAGWYEDATFEADYTARPEYVSKQPGLPLDDQGKRFSYTLSSASAVRIDPAQTPFVFSGERMKRSSIFYLRGNNPKEAWREEVAKELLAIRRSYERGKLRPTPPIGKAGGICADPERRRNVEIAAIDRVRANYPELRFEIDDRQAAKCGFDLLVRPKSSPSDELHIEVKGTQNASPHFLMSHSEYAYMLANPKHWRLAMVTNALSKKPDLEIMDSQEARSRFFWKEFTWHATAKP